MCVCVCVCESRGAKVMLLRSLPTPVISLALQIAQSRYYLQTLDTKVGTICILGALGYHPDLLECSSWGCGFQVLGLRDAGSYIHIPIVSIVVPFFGLANFILRILNGNPKKELQWRL